MSLDRFIEAQERHWPVPLEEVQRGRKATHWMWFVFPQLKRLGRSTTAQHFGIDDLKEAKSYLEHPVLGARLVAISNAMLAHSGQSADSILGPVDALKLRSCMTLFRVAGGDPVFGRVLEAFYDGIPCAKTEEILGSSTSKKS